MHIVLQTTFCFPCKVRLEKWREAKTPDPQQNIF